MIYDFHPGEKYACRRILNLGTHTQVLNDNPLVCVKCRDTISREQWVTFRNRHAEFETFVGREDLKDWYHVDQYKFESGLFYKSRFSTEVYPANRLNDPLVTIPGGSLLFCVGSGTGGLAHSRWVDFLYEEKLFRYYWTEDHFRFWDCVRQQEESVR